MGSALSKPIEGMTQVSNAREARSRTTKQTLNIFLGVTALAIASTSISLAINSNYGGHHDIYLMLGSFLSVLHEGIYVPSRFTGYPVAEIGIGASAWIGGSSLSNTLNYSLFLASVLAFPFCFDAKPTLTRYLAFTCMTLSSTVLAFDNIMSIDYPWSTFFWIAACASLKQFENRTIAIIPLALAIGSRPVFALFALAAILLVDGKQSEMPRNLLTRLQERWVEMVTVTFTGCLFYLPAWLKHGFGLSWISAVAPDNQGFTGLVARFTFKLIGSFGVFQSSILLALGIYICFCWLSKRKNKLKITGNDARFLLTISAINLIVFARMPVQLSYLQPLLYCVYYAISRLRDIKLAAIAVLLAGLNLLNWKYQPKIIKISYESTELCSKTVARDAKLGLWIDEGRMDEFKRNSKKSQCYRGWFQQIRQADYSSVIINGQPLNRANARSQANNKKT